MSSLFRRSYVDKKTGRRIKTSKWYGKYADGDGVARRVPLSANKAAAQAMLAELTRRAEMERAGVRDPYRDHRSRPLAAHLTDWQAALTADGNTAEYVTLKVSRARRVIDAACFRFVPDLSASKVQTVLAGMRGGERCSAQTSNHYLGAVKQFARWLVADRRTADNPLAHIEGGNVRLDRRHVRRDFTDDELARVIQAAETAGERRHLPGPDRAVLYTVAAYTGLRASELASLTPGSFDLSDRPTVTVAAGYSKHRREDVVPLHPDLVRRLVPWLAGKPAGVRLWPGTWASSKGAGKLLRLDTDAARAAWIGEAGDDAERTRRESSDFLLYRDRAGRVIDFHALRHTFISRLVRAGVAPKDAQTLARHSTITLTMDRYAHTGGDESAIAVGRLPALPVAPAANLTGPVAGPKLAPTGDSGGSPVMTGGGADGSGGATPDSSQTVDNEGDRGELIATDERRGRDSNPRNPFGFSGFRDRCLKPLEPPLRAN